MTAPTRLRSEPAQEPSISRPAPLARRVLAGQITEGSTVTFDGTEDGDGLRIL